MESMEMGELSPISAAVGGGGEGGEGGIQLPPACSDAEELFPVIWEGGGEGTRCS